jgi:AraC-like DNA-binding protein
VEFPASHIDGALDQSRKVGQHAHRSRHIGEDGQGDLAVGQDTQAAILPLGSGAISVWSNGTRFYLAKDQPCKPAETLTIIVQTRGQVRIDRRDKSVSLEAGQAVVFLNSDIEKIDFSQDGTALSLHLPIASVALLVSDVGKILMVPQSTSKEALRLLVNYAATLYALDAPMTPDLAHTASSHLFDLVANALADIDLSPQAAERDGIRTARKQAIKEDITVNLTRQDLSPDDIAQRLGITPRYLRKLLQDDGTSFSNLVRHMRLQKALEMLGDPRHITRSISTIAYQAGFSDLSYFNRCFRRQFGVTPTEIRANVLPRS